MILTVAHFGLLVASKILPREKYISLLLRVYSDRIELLGHTPPRFISPDVVFDKSAKIYIGGNVTIAANALILTHDYSIDYGLISINENEMGKEHCIKKSVWIGDNTFVGQRVIILPGIHIGSNCIIGAGSTISKDVPNNSVVAGNPAKIINNTSEWIQKKREKEIIY